MSERSVLSVDVLKAEEIGKFKQAGLSRIQGLVSIKKWPKEGTRDQVAGSEAGKGH